MKPSDADPPNALAQLWFAFWSDRPSTSPRQDKQAQRAWTEPSLAKAVVKRESGVHAADDLTALSSEWLTQLGMPGAASLVRVFWNSRLSSTAGYASFPAWRVELNPRLREFEGQVERTLRHELAHLIAYQQAGRRRIEPHGAEWKQACAMLGIPDERACHRLPLPRREVSRRYVYQCPLCQQKVHRVRRFRRASACYTCCAHFNGGMYDDRFRLVLLKESSATSGKRPAKKAQ